LGIKESGDQETAFKTDCSHKNFISGLDLVITMVRNILQTIPVEPNQLKYTIFFRPSTKRPEKGKKEAFSKAIL